MKKLTLLLILFSTALSSKAIVVSGIEYLGLQKTKKEYLESFTRLKAGMHYQENIWKNDIQLIRNTNLFFEVTWKMENVENEIKLTVNLKESTYLIPILDVSFIPENFKVQLGGSNINWLGKNYTIGGFYQYYQRHSFKLFTASPRHLNGKTGHAATIGSYSSIEPLYFAQDKSDFNYANYSMDISGYYWFSNYHRASIGGMLMKEKYENIERSVGDYDIGFTLDLFKYQIKAFFEYKRVNLHHQYFDGLYYKLYVENIETQHMPEASFLKLMGTFKYYKKIRELGNFAFNLDLAIATNNFSPFSPFVLDSYINVRGIGNRVARGTALAVVNAEYRQTVWTNKLFYLQANGFVDIGSLRPPGGKVQEMFAPANYDLFAGVGLRIHTRKIYNVVFRIDYGLNTQDLNHNGFVFGINQFF
ncbi:MAG: outer membrane protein insertion porin family [Parvicellaceae bacterium]